MIKHYRTENGVYLGAFDVVPENGVEAPPPNAASDIWGGNSWSAAPSPPLADADNILTPPQFAWMLAIKGWDDVWDSVNIVAKETNRPLYAILTAQRAEEGFNLQKTLAFLSRPDVQLIAGAEAPSEEDVRQQWEIAKTAPLDEA